MRKHTQEFKNKIKEFGRQIDSKLTFGDITLGNEQLNAVTPVLQSAMLKSVMKELDIDSNVDIPIGTIINYKHGVLLDSGDYEYLDYGNYQVYSCEKQEDTNSYNIVAYDKMLNSMKDYTTLQSKEVLNKSFPMSIKEYIECLCTDINLEFANKENEFANWDRMLGYDPYENLGYTYRDILDELAQVTASNIIINENDELEIKYITDTNDTIDEEYLKDINVAFGEKYGKINSIVLSRSAGSDNVYLRDEQSVSDNGLCEIKISDNQIMNNNDRDTYLPDILEKLNGLEFYINDFSSTGVCYYEVADRYNVKIGDNTYTCVMFNDEIDISQGLEEIIHTDLPEQAETDYTKADKTDRRINQTYLIVDKQNQTIESVVSQVGEQNEKISQVTQTVDQLKQEIQNVATLTIDGETRNAELNIVKIYGGSPISIKVHPIGEHIDLTYPTHTIYPSDNTYTRIKSYLRIEQVGGDFTYDYDMPELLYMDENNYDEFEFDYGQKKCFKTKRLDFDGSGNLIVLDSPTIEDLPYLDLDLPEGDYKFTLLDGYTNAYIYGKFVSQNDYTDLFATKVELRSNITQTEDKIESEVGKVTSLLDTEVENLDTKITQTADGITQSVTAQITDIDGRVQNVEGSLDLYIKKNDKDEVVSAFNLNSNEVVITSDNFKLDAQGNMQANNGLFSGKIKGSSFTGNTENIKLQIGTDSNGDMSSNNSLELIKVSDNSLMLGFYVKYWSYPNQRALYINSLANSYIFFNSPLVQAGNFRITGTPTNSNDAMRMQDFPTQLSNYIQTGTCQLNQSDTTVYFPKAFSTTPKVFLQCTVGAGNSMYAAHIVSVTATYFQAYVPVVGLNTPQSFSWVAVAL